MQIIGNKLIIIMQHYIFIETIQVGMSIIGYLTIWYVSWYVYAIHQGSWYNCQLLIDKLISN